MHLKIKLLSCHTASGRLRTQTASYHHWVRSQINLTTLRFWWLHVCSGCYMTTHGHWVASCPSYSSPAQDKDIYTMALIGCFITQLNPFSKQIESCWEICPQHEGSPSPVATVPSLWLPCDAPTPASVLLQKLQGVVKTCQPGPENASVICFLWNNALTFESHSSSVKVMKQRGLPTERLWGSDRH